MPVTRDWFSAVDPQRRTDLEHIRRQAGGVCYLVGGFVRDRLLGLTPDDFDVVIEGDAIALAHDLMRALGGGLVVHPPFGTAIWHSPAGLAFDLVSARREVYPAPAALPQVRLGATLADDLRRRDFTINAMALALSADDRRLVDPLGGVADLARGLIRALHPHSFIDDPTRLFRAVRYEQRYGFAIEPETAGWMATGLGDLPALSADRARHELEWIVDEPETGNTWARLQTLGVWVALAPNLAWGEPARAGWEAWVRARAELGRLLGVPDPADADLAVALALAGAGAPGSAAIARLNLTRVMGRALLAAHSLGDPPRRVSRLVATLEPLGPLGLVVAWARHPDWREAIERYGREWQQVRPHTTGADLIARGLRPGPEFGRLLSGLRAAVLDGEATTAEAEHDWLEHHRSKA